MSFDITKLDLYRILDVAPDATDKEIVKSYRKKALKCHPDKNPDDANAASVFDELSKALEVLTDAGTRAAYDKVLKARKAAEIRHRELDSKRKKLKEDLEARERQSATGKTTKTTFVDKTAAEKLQAEIERLRKEGSKLLEEEQEHLKEQLSKGVQEEEEEENEDKPAPRLKLKWKARKGDSENGGYSKEYLLQLLSKYGEIKCIIVSTKKNGSAILEYDSPHSALLAVQNEIGLASNPLTLSWISGEPTAAQTSSKVTPQSNQSYAPMASSERDFESVVLMKMRQAEERRRLIEQMQKDEDG